MNKFLTFLSVVLITLITSCSKDNEQSNSNGSVEVKMTYFFNDAQGYKADVGASIFLFKQTQKSIDYEKSSPRIGKIWYVGDSKEVYQDYEANAGADGVATIENVSNGDYLLVAKSKGRMTFSIKPISVNNNKVSATKAFGYKSELDIKGESW